MGNLYLTDSFNEAEAEAQLADFTAYLIRDNAMKDKKNAETSKLDQERYQLNTGGLVDIVYTEAHPTDTEMLDWMIEKMLQDGALYLSRDIAGQTTLRAIDGNESVYELGTAISPRTAIKAAMKKKAPPAG